MHDSNCNNSAANKQIYKIPICKNIMLQRRCFAQLRSNYRDISRPTLYSTCLPGWPNMRVTGNKHVPELGRPDMFLLSPRNICVSLAKNFVAPYTVSEVAKLGGIEGACVKMSLARCRPGLARLLQ